MLSNRMLTISGSTFGSSGEKFAAHVVPTLQIKKSAVPAPLADASFMPSLDSEPAGMVVRCFIYVKGLWEIFRATRENRARCRCGNGRLGKKFRLAREYRRRNGRRAGVTYAVLLAKLAERKLCLQRLVIIKRALTVYPG
jgi:hypothetical protein